MNSCIVERCDKPAKRRKMCDAHYSKWRRHGDPTKSVMTPKGEPRQFIENMLSGGGANECIFWPYSVGNKGYGNIRISGRTASAHRYVCERVHGAPPFPRAQAAHSCGNGHLGCVNPRHIRWATNSENQMDRAQHGTANRGEQHGASKLLDEDVLFIRKSKGILSANQLARRYGVSGGNIRQIWSGRTWWWLESEKLDLKAGNQ